MLFFLDSFRIIGDSIGLPSLNRNSVSTERVDTPSLATLHACPYPLPHRRTVGLLKRRTLLRNAACAIH